MALKVLDIGEKELVKYIISRSKDITPDDTAITPFNDSHLISTCDMLIQSRHFPENMSYFNMGFKAVTVNVSDLAAMGAEGFGFLLAIALPKDLELDAFKEIIDVTGTALGLCDRPLMKDTYSIGDVIAITGDIGYAALGFEMDVFDNVYVKKALKPIARLDEGISIRNAGATSATDITDGIASELYEMKKNHFGFMIYEELLGISDEYKSIANELDLNYLDLILHVGEDFELLFTISKENLEKLPIDYKVIGEVTTSDKIEITLENGFVEEIINKGYEHYVSE